VSEARAVKDSGVEWLGEVPQHWEVRRLGSLGRFTKGAGGSKEDSRDDGVPVVRYGELYTQFNLTIDKPYSFIDDEATSRYTPLKKGLLVFTASGEDPAEIGKAAVSLLDPPAYVGGDTILFAANTRDADGKFLAYVLDSQPLRALKAMRSTGFTVVHISAGALKTLPLPTPPLAEQRAIADFLDRETAQIDEFVAENERFIELLTERRAAVIAHAVTKGLDPDAPMRDSGVEWLGEVPETWDVMPVKGAARKVTDGAHISPETDGGEYDFVSTRDVSERGIDFDGSLKTSPATYHYLVRTGCQPVAGDVLFSKDGTVGVTAVVSESREFVVASSLIIIRPLPRRADSRFLSWSLGSPGFREQASTWTRGAGLPRLSVVNLSRLPVAIPPLAEQRAIADYLDERTARIDEAIATAREGIALASERRSALISAAVTGKIDVGSGS